MKSLDFGVNNSKLTLVIMNSASQSHRQVHHIFFDFFTSLNVFALLDDQCDKNASLVNTTAAPLLFPIAGITVSIAAGRQPQE